MVKKRLRARAIPAMRRMMETARLGLQLRILSLPMKSTRGVRTTAKRAAT
jgi:hypothetical protein